MDKWELTPEVYARFRDEKNKLSEVLSMHYETVNMTEDKLLSLMMKAAKDCKEKKSEEAEDILMGLAVSFGDYIVENLEECWWESSRYVCHRERSFIEQYGFRYNGYNGKKYGYLCYRGKGICI